MFSSIGKVKSSFINTYFILASLVLLLVLFIRVTRGLDLTDEMQYYGEIKGLIETGKLFSNDLFIQQSVYILLYPVFFVYHLVFNFEGLVFFGRLLMAGLSVVVFLYTYHKLMGLKFTSVVASLTALSLTYSIPYHGIFAPSYNTVSQALWIIFIIKFFEWKQSSAFSWGIIPVIMAFAHPTSAMTMSLLVLLRFLVERDFRQAAKVLLALLSFALIALPIVFYFATPPEYLNSLIFSSGYGVGTAFFSSKSQPIALLVIYTIFGSCLFFWRRLLWLNFAFLTIVLTVTAIVLYSMCIAVGGYTTRTVYILCCLSSFAYIWVLSNNAGEDTKFHLQPNWLVLALLAYATTLGVTSGNGIGQATGAFMVGLPLLLGFAVNSAPKKKIQDDFLKIACIVLVSILFMVHWINYPYRDSVWWQARRIIQNVPEFKFINISQERADFINAMQKNLGPVVQRKRTLIVSEYPGLYFALGTHAETCMLYMHSLTSDKSEKILLGCLSKKKPEVVVNIFLNDDIIVENSRMKRVMYSHYFQRAVNCDEQLIKIDAVTKHNPDSLKYTVCF